MPFTLKKCGLVGVLLGSLGLVGVAQAYTYTDQIATWQVSQPCYMGSCTVTMAFHPWGGQTFRLDIDNDYPETSDIPPTAPSNRPLVTQMCQVDGSPSCTYTTPAYQTYGYHQMVVWVTEQDNGYQTWDSQGGLVDDPRDRPGGTIRFLTPRRMTRRHLLHLVSDKPTLDVQWVAFSKAQQYNEVGFVRKVREWRDPQGRYQWLGRLEGEYHNGSPLPLPSGRFTIDAVARVGRKYDKYKDTAKTNVVVYKKGRH